jgi:hypothetical protein
MSIFPKAKVQRKGLGQRAFVPSRFNVVRALFAMKYQFFYGLIHSLVDKDL